MARYRSRSMATRPVQRIKHVVDAQGTVSLGTDFAFVLARSDDTPTGNAECQTASTVNGFYIRVEVASNDDLVIGATPNVYLMVAKNIGGAFTMPSPNAVGASDLKRYVIHQEMTMIENKGKGSNARTLFNGVVVIPKGMRRMGPGDIWNCTVLCPQLDTAQCLQCHYKEFR